MLSYYMKNYKIALNKNKLYEYNIVKQRSKERPKTMAGQTTSKAKDQLLLLHLYNLAKQIRKPRKCY